MLKLFRYTILAFLVFTCSVSFSQTDTPTDTPTCTPTTTLTNTPSRDREDLQSITQPKVSGEDFFSDLLNPINGEPSVEIGFDPVGGYDDEIDDWYRIEGTQVKNSRGYAILTQRLKLRNNTYPTPEPTSGMSFDVFQVWVDVEEDVEEQTPSRVPPWVSAITGTSSNQENTGTGTLDGGGAQLQGGTFRVFNMGSWTNEKDDTFYRAEKSHIDTGLGVQGVVENNAWPEESIRKAVGVEGVVRNRSNQQPAALHKHVYRDHDSDYDTYATNPTPKAALIGEAYGVRSVMRNKKSANAHMRHVFGVYGDALDTDQTSGVGDPLTTLDNWAVFSSGDLAVGWHNLSPTPTGTPISPWVKNFTVKGNNGDVWTAGSLEADRGVVIGSNITPTPTAGNLYVGNNAYINGKLNIGNANPNKWNNADLTIGGEIYHTNTSRTHIRKFYDNTYYFNEAWDPSTNILSYTLEGGDIFTIDLDNGSTVIGDSNNETLIVDTTTNKVGVNCSPSYGLHVDGTFKATGNSIIDGNTSLNGDLILSADRKFTQDEQTSPADSPFELGGLLQKELTSYLVEYNTSFCTSDDVTGARIALGPIPRKVFNADVKVDAVNLKIYTDSNGEYVDRVAIYTGTFAGTATMIGSAYTTNIGENSIGVETVNVLTGGDIQPAGPWFIELDIETTAGCVTIDDLAIKYHLE